MDLEKNYSILLDSAVKEIQSAKIKVARKVNEISVSVYWNLGKLLYDSKINTAHGSGVVEKLSLDLKCEFPDMGLSPRNLWNMKRFYERYLNSDQKLLRCVAVLPWSQNLYILDKTKTDEEAYFYASKSVEFGWTRDVLLNYIKANAFISEFQMEKFHNFNETLPNDLADQADEILKSTYNLGFLNVLKPIKERELEARLVEKIKHFILELGKGFTFIGNQYRIEFNNKDYYVDMLFFNRDLNSLVAIELKVGEFLPEYIGKMNFYLTLLDRLEKRASENNSIGIILCADKNHFDVEIALQDIHKPIAVAEYELLLPKKQLEELIRKELNEIELENKEIEN